MLRKYRKHEARLEQKERWARIRKFKAAASQRTRFRAVARIPAWSVVFLPILVGCATTTSEVGQVKEVAPGTYRIGVAGGGSVLFGSHEAANAAVDQAGQYCHSKGQKLIIL